MRNKSGLFWAWLLTLPLLFFSATRNVGLILTTMRGDALSIVAGFFAIFALDVGVLIWIVMLDKANGEEQGHVAMIFIVVDLAGAITGMLADTLLVGAEESVQGFVRFVAQWAVPLIIGANFVGGVIYKLKDPTRAEDMERRAMQREIERQRVLARLEMERAQADAEISLERARAAQIRQNTALDMLNQARAMLPGGDGREPDMSAMNSEGAEAPKGRRRQ